MARVARAVGTHGRAVDKRRVEEGRRRLLGVAEVAFGHRVAHDDDLADPPGLARGARLGVDDAQLGAGARTADGERALVNQLRIADLDVGDRHGRLGGTVRVRDAGTREPLAQSRSRGAAQGLAAEQEQAHVGQQGFVEAAVGQAQVGERRRGRPHFHARIA